MEDNIFYMTDGYEIVKAKNISYNNIREMAPIYTTERKRHISGQIMLHANNDTVREVANKVRKFQKKHLILKVNNIIIYGCELLDYLYKEEDETIEVHFIARCSDEDRVFY